MTVVNVAAPPPVHVATSAPIQQPVTPRAATAAPLAVLPAENPGATGSPPVSAPAVANPAAGKSEKPGLLARLNPFRSKPERAAAPTGTVVVVNPAVTSPAESGASASKKFPRYTYSRPAAPAAGNRPEAQRAFAAGVKAQDSGNPAEAARQYDLAATADPSYFDAQYNYAVLTMRANAAGSLPIWEKVLAIDPDSVNARHSFALALKQAGFVEDAVAELEKIIETKPSEARAHLTLANICAQQLGDARRAREHYMKVVELDPRDPQAPAIRFWLAANP